jgi:hypothetical protein
MNTSNSIFRSITIPATGTAILLLIPLIAMQFTDEVVWTFIDFAVAGVLLFGTGLTYMLVTRSSGSIAYRIAIGFALFTGLLLIWVNLAVGIIGTESNPANTMYFGVFFIGIIGALIARFKPKGMTYTMTAMAVAVALAAAIALITGMQHAPESSVIHILGVNGFFIMLFAGSALMFRYFGEEQEVSE